MEDKVLDLDRIRGENKKKLDLDRIRAGFRSYNHEYHYSDFHFGGFVGSLSLLAGSSKV